MNQSNSVPNRPRWVGDRRQRPLTMHIRTFVMLMTVPVILVLFISSFFLWRGMHRINDSTELTRLSYLPAILENQRVAINIEAMRRYSMVIYLDPDPAERRKARISAQTLGAEINAHPKLSLRESLNDIHNQFALLEAQKEMAEDAKNSALSERQTLEIVMRNCIWKAIRETNQNALLNRLHAMPSLYTIQDGMTLDRLPQLENDLLNMVDELSIVAPASLHQDIDTLRFQVPRALDAYSTSLMQAERVKMLRSALNMRLRSLRDERNLSAVDKTYATLVSIGEQISWMMYAIYACCLFMTIAVLFFIILAHHFLIKPIVTTSSKLQDIRTGKDTPPVPPWRIDELNEVATLINISGEQISLLYRHTRELEREKEKIESIAITDGLTGLYNRRYFDIQFHVLREDALIKRTPLSVIMMDIDLFKVYNDTLGHSAGDDCLVQVAKAIENSLQRKTDMAFRYGGEEFVVLLPSCPADVGREYAERIRENVQALNIVHPDSPVSPVVTVSVGVATLTQQHPVEGKRLLDLADSAMYQAKTEGRNRVRAAASL